MTNQQDIVIKAADGVAYETLRDFYYEVIDAMVPGDAHPGWIRDVYPNEELLQGALVRGEFFIAQVAGRVAAAMILDQRYNDGFRAIDWSVAARDEELLVVHTLAVHPDFAGAGLAKAMVNYAIGTAKDRGLKTLRLDVIEGNTRAERVYQAVGFVYRGTVAMHYEDTGVANFRLFEYVL